MNAVLMGAIASVARHAVYVAGVPDLRRNGCETTIRAGQLSRKANLRWEGGHGVLTQYCSVCTVLLDLVEGLVARQKASTSSARTKLE